MKIISGKQMCRVLEQRGWTLARINGSHHIYRDPATGRRAVVPVHANKDLKPGTQRGIIRDAWLPQIISYSGYASRMTWVAKAISSDVAFRLA